MFVLELLCALRYVSNGLDEGWKAAVAGNGVPNASFGGGLVDWGAPRALLE